MIGYSGVVSTIAVNVSAIQFYQTDFYEMVQRVLEETKMLPHHLELELTEGIFIDNPKMAVAIMEKFTKNGISFVLDDFGTGYSSLSYLKNLPFKKLKIDKSFVDNILTNSSDKDIIKAIIVMAKSLGMKTLAEGAETKEQVQYLQKIGCDEVQGYFFSAPLSADKLEAFVKQKHQLHS